MVRSARASRHATTADVTPCHYIVSVFYPAIVLREVGPASDVEARHWQLFGMLRRAASVKAWRGVTD